MKAGIGKQLGSTLTLYDPSPFQIMVPSSRGPESSWILYLQLREKRRKVCKVSSFKGASTANDAQYTLHIPLSVIQSCCPSNHWTAWELDLAVWSGGKADGAREQGHCVRSITSPGHSLQWLLPSRTFTVSLRPTQTSACKAQPVPGPIQSAPKFKDMCGDWILYLFFSPQTCPLSYFPFIFISALFFLTSKAFTLMAWQYFAIFYTFFKNP